MFQIAYPSWPILAIERSEVKNANGIKHTSKVVMRPDPGSGFDRNIEKPIEIAIMNGIARNLAISLLLVRDRKSLSITADSTAPTNGRLSFPGL